MHPITILGIDIPSWLYIPLCYFLWVSALLLIKKIAFVYIRKITSKTQTKIDDVFIAAADVPLILFIFASGGAMLEWISPFLTQAPLTNYFLMAFKVTTIIAIVIFIDRFISGLISIYGVRLEVLRTSGGIIHGLIRAIVVCLGGLILLDSFGISITPVIASLGIGSLGVALALQPTLENLFSGIQILTDKPIIVGQFIKLESGEEGYVHQIGWRSTWIRLPPNNMVIIPNKTLVNARVINYYYPSTDMALPIELGVHYNSDLDHVERVTIEIAQEVMREVKGGVPEFVPIVRFHAFADSSVNFCAILRAREFSDAGIIKHEFIKRLHKRYAKEGIIIPYPIQAVNIAQERAFENPEPLEQKFNRQ